jgi:hypothetical protein
MSKPNVTFETLRLIAETASGLRDLDTWFVIRETPEGTRYSFKHKPVKEHEDTVVIHCAAVMDRVSPANQATIGVKGVVDVNLMSVMIPATAPGTFSQLESGSFEADAVFWSVSAVEKFMVPYYASVYGDQGPAYAKAVMDAMLLPDRDPNRFADEETEEPAFALVHLPSSEYVPAFAPHVAALRTNGRHSFVKHAGVKHAEADQGSSARTNGSRETYARSSGR